MVIVDVVIWVEYQVDDSLEYVLVTGQVVSV